MASLLIFYEKNGLESKGAAVIIMILRALWWLYVDQIKPNRVDCLLYLKCLHLNHI
jgi:hypothetical protein